MSTYLQEEEQAERERLHRAARTVERVELELREARFDRLEAERRLAARRKAASDNLFEAGNRLRAVLINTPCLTLEAYEAISRVLASQENACGVLIEEVVS